MATAVVLAIVFREFIVALVKQLIYGAIVYAVLLAVLLYLFSFWPTLNEALEGLAVVEGFAVLVLILQRRMQ